MLNSRSITYCGSHLIFNTDGGMLSDCAGVVCAVVGVFLFGIRRMELDCSISQLAFPLVLVLIACILFASMRRFDFDLENRTVTRTFRAPFDIYRYRANLDSFHTIHVSFFNHVYRKPFLDPLNKGCAFYFFVKIEGGINTTICRTTNLHEARKIAAEIANFAKIPFTDDTIELTRKYLPRDIQI